MVETVDKVITSEEAIKVLKDEQKTKTDACKKEVLAICEKHGCTIDVAMVVRQGSTQAMIQFVPKGE